MPPRRAPNRPQTLKEARRAYLKRGGSSYMSNEERQRLIRAQEREEKRVERVKKEAARLDAAKKRAESAAKRREEQRRLGIPSVKISNSQMRIGAFLKGRGPDEVDHLDSEQKNDTPEQKTLHLMGETDNTIVAPWPIEEHPSDPQSQEEDFGSDIEDQEILALGVGPVDAPQPPSTQNKKKPVFPATDLRSSFFESNSQVEREVNDGVAASPIEQHSVEVTPEQDIEPVSTPKATSTQHILPAPDIKTPERSEIESLLFAMPSQEFDLLSSSPPRAAPRTT